MPAPKILLNSGLLLSSVLLIGLSLASLAITGHVFKTMATEFPGDEYVWLGIPSAPPVGFWMVTLAYDWTAENLVWATSGLSIVAGILGLYTFYSNVRKNKDQSTYTSNHLTGSWPSALAALFAVVAFLTTLISFIYVMVRKADMNRIGGTCNSYAGYSANNIFVCSRELAACNIIEQLSYQAPEARKRACKETKAVRLMMIPLFVFSLVLVGCYAAQMYTRKKGAKWMTADQRVETLQREAE